MNIEKIGAWLQIFSSIALVIGIFLVLEELEQQKRLAHAQLTSDSVNQGLQRTLSLLGENPMSSLAKACRADGELDYEDALVLDNLFLAYLTTVARAYQVDAVGEFGDERWKQIANSNFSIVFSSEHGRAWWRTIRTVMKNEELVSYGDDLLSNLSDPSCSARANAILQVDIEKRVGT